MKAKAGKIWLIYAALFAAVIMGAITYAAHVLPKPSGVALNSEAPLEARESLYNNIYIYRMKDYMAMTFGYNRRLYVESFYKPEDELDLPAPYTRYMTVGLAYARDVKSILLIGFGGGRTDWYLHRSLPDVKITSVELDPVVIELARKYFGIKDEPNFNIVNQDGRTFLAESKDHYDMILIDAYRGPFVPFHLLTKEFYQIVKNHLSEGGVVTQNVEPTTMLFDSAVRTINSVFPEEDFYLAHGNVVTVAYDGPPRSSADLARTAEERQNAYHLRYALPVLLKNRRRLMEDGPTIDPDAKVLTDDFAPVESLHAIEQHNRKWPDLQPNE